MIQPITDLRTKQRVEIAVNHEGGQPVCITSLEAIEKVQSVFCLGCKK